MPKRCKVCGGRMVASGKVQYKNPVTKRAKASSVLRCVKCGHRLIE